MHWGRTEAHIATSGCAFEKRGGYIKTRVILLGFLKRLEVMRKRGRSASVYVLIWKRRRGNMTWTQMDFGSEVYLE
jgi:hypothetical protein